MSLTPRARARHADADRGVPASVEVGAVVRVFAHGQSAVTAAWGPGRVESAVRQVEMRQVVASPSGQTFPGRPEVGIAPHLRRRACRNPRHALESESRITP